MSEWFKRFLAHSKEKGVRRDFLTILDARIESLGGKRTTYSAEKVEQRRLDALRQAGKPTGSFKSLSDK